MGTDRAIGQNAFRPGQRAATQLALLFNSQAVKEGYYDKDGLLVAIDPAAVGDPALFRAIVEVHIAEVKAVKKAPGVEEIHVDGEQSFAERELRIRAVVPIEDGVWGQVGELAQEFEISLPQP